VGIGRSGRLRTQLVGDDLHPQPVTFVDGVDDAVDRQQTRLRCAIQPYPLAAQPQLPEPFLLVSRIRRVHAHRIEYVLRELDVLLGPAFGYRQTDYEYY